MHAGRRFRLRGRLRKVSWAVLVSGVGFMVVNATSIVGANPARPVAHSTPLPLPRRANVLVFAPHPDDETLAAGGLIRETIRRGGTARVVVVTNGDSFRLAAERAMEKVRLRPRDYVELGQMRQHEVMNAARALGLAPADVITLGFPDKGLAQLWLDRGHQLYPYRSKSTQVSAVPYPGVWEPGAPYTGEDLVRIMETVMDRYRPDIIVAPARADLHPDHWATGLFVETALDRARLNGQDWARHVRVYRYVIHRQEWYRRQPENIVAMRSGLVPAGPLTGPWVRLDLTDDDMAAKRRAISAHQSQVAVMPRFMYSFVQRSELFQVSPPELGAAAFRQQAHTIRRVGASGVGYLLRP